MGSSGSNAGKCPKYLFSKDLEDIFRRAISSHIIAVFLDYDGTLTPLPRGRMRLERPLSEAARNAIYELSRHDKVRIFITSGRSVESLRKFINIDDLYYIGIHGHIIKGPDIDYTHSALKELKGIISYLKPRLYEALSSISEVVIEDKDAALAIHYRGAGKNRSKEILDKVARICSEYYGVKILRGKSMVEIVPNTGWDKGKAIDYVLAFLSRKMGIEAKDITPIYFGDDRSDEEGFKLLRRRGVSVRVGYKCKTHAEYYVNDTNEVIRFLSELRHMITSTNRSH